MPNKDGVVSIGFNFKKELDEACSAIEKELNSIGGDINLSEGLKKQIKELKTALESLQKDFSTSFDKIGKSKLDTKTFSDFEKKVNKQLSSIKTEIGNLKSQLGSIDKSVGIDNISKQLDNLDASAKKVTKTMSDLIGQTKVSTKQNTFIDTDSTIKGLQEVKKLLADVSKENFNFGYKNKSALELTKSLDNVLERYGDIGYEIDNISDKIGSMNKGTQTYKELELQLSKLRLELGKCALEMDDIFTSFKSSDIDWSKIPKDENTVYGWVNDTLEDLEKFKVEAQNIIDSIEPPTIKKTKTNSNTKETKHDLSKGKVGIPVELSTKQSTINKQLDEMIANLQERAAKSPIVAPVKLRVDSEYEKPEKDINAPAITQNQIDEARKSAEGVIPGLEKAFNNSMRIATNKAVETAKESIKSVREFFETNPIVVHLTIPDDEKAKIGKAILSEDGKTTVDISGEVNKARKSVKGLSEDLEKSQLLIKENAQNAKNLSLEKLVDSLSDALKQFSEIKSIVTSIQNMESTMAMTSGISSATELKEQWELIEKSVINATKLDGSFRKNAKPDKILSEYQKYINMGGTNDLFNIDKIKGNQETLAKLYKEAKDFSKQPLENDSIKKLSVDLDSVIAKFDELISTVKTATNALYKIIKVGNVSDIDKQWSSISDKFKSIADESGKINLNKQKKDVKELMEMYQKYESMGGTNSLANITDNVDTLRKLDNEYKKLNQTKEVDNSANIKKEVSSFNEVEKSVDSLTTAIGDKKVQAINIEATTMVDAAEREILAVRGILDNLDLIVDRLKSIKGIKIPKFDVGNIDKVQKALESLNGLSGNESNVSSTIKDVIQGDVKASADSSVPSVKNEDSLMKQLADSADKASKGKDKFAESNKKVKQSADTSAKSIKEETNALDKKEWDKNVKAIQEYMNANTKLNNLKAKDAGTGKHASEIAYQTEQVKELEKVAINARTALSSMINPHDVPIDDWNKWLDVMRKFDQATEGSKESVAKLEDSMRNMKKSQLESIQSIINNAQSKYDSYNSRERKSNDYASKIKEISNALNELREIKESLKNSPSIASDEEIKHVEELKNIISKNIADIGNMPASAKGVSENAVEKLIGKISKALKENTNYSEKAKSELNGYLDLLKTKNPSLNLGKIEAGFIRITNEEREAGREGKRFFDVLSDKVFLNRAAQLASYYLSFTDFIRYGQEAINVIRELDTALVDLKKTTTMSGSEMENFYFEANDVAKEMGVTTSAIIDQASAWSRLGYNTKEASTEMAKLSSKFATISPGMETEQAQEGLVSIMKAWDIDVDQVESEVIDKINILGKLILPKHTVMYGV